MTVKAIIPSGKIIDVKKHERAIANSLQAAARGAKVDFNTTTQTWNSRPDFEIKGDGIEPREVSTDNEIYGYVDEGTKEHDIFPVHATSLAFDGFPKGSKGKFKAKTKVKVIGSYAGKKGDTPIVLPAGRGVHHPGTEAREFSTVIQEKWIKQLPVIMQRALDAINT